MIELGMGVARSSVAPEAFFARWLDHETWPEWDPETLWVRMDGPAELGRKGSMKPRSGPVIRFSVTTFDPPREYTDTSRLPGAQLVFQHTASAVDGGTQLRARATVEGPLAWMWTVVLGRQFRSSVQANLDRLVSLVEAES